ncbi:MAG: creatininase family protein, partial [Candidatus Aminicenantes bacterium]|nr:creatininase family protein [Candidatus Aminicenantes bacterium]
MKRAVFAVLVLAGLIRPSAAPSSQAARQAPTTREMNLLGWQEFGELVPAKIATVLLPVGSLEAHGVIPNGTDNLAPVAMAGEIAGRLNALIAPPLNYGVTPGLKAYP